MAFQLPNGGGITGTNRLATGVTGSAYGLMNPATGATGNVTGYGQSATAGSTALTPAIQTIWSKEILFQAMPVLRFEQFAVKKTELGVMPGLTVNFMRYNNLPIPSGPLVEGIRMQTLAITAQQYRITVAEQGQGIAMSELLLNASFDDVLASSSRLLGRSMATYMDLEARSTIQSASSVVYGYSEPASITTGRGIYNSGTQGTATTIDDAAAAFKFTPAAVKDATYTLASKNIPRLGDTYICFIHPAQSRQIRDTPEFIEVTKYAAPGNFMLGEIGRLYDTVFIETTQIGHPLSVDPGFDYTPYYQETYSGGGSLDWRPEDASTGGLGSANPYEGPLDVLNGSAAADVAMDAGYAPTAVAQPGWDQSWVSGYPAGGGGINNVLEALMLGDNSFGHAISLPVELRDGGVLDFGREHALAWYAIWGFGLITDSAVVKIRTN